MFASSDLILPKLLSERGAVDAQQLGGGSPIAAALLERCTQQGRFNHREESIIEGRLDRLAGAVSGLSS
jgi:hypothetical protein